MTSGRGYSNLAHCARLKADVTNHRVGHHLQTPTTEHREGGTSSLGMGRGVWIIGLSEFKGLGEGAKGVGRIASDPGTGE